MVSHSNLGQFEKALENGLEDMPLSPNNFFACGPTARSYRLLGRLAEAKKVLKEALDLPLLAEARAEYAKLR